MVVGGSLENVGSREVGAPGVTATWRLPPVDHPHLQCPSVRKGSWGWKPLGGIFPAKEIGLVGPRVWIKAGSRCGLVTAV